jgi:hypothetical protein
MFEKRERPSAIRTTVIILIFVFLLVGWLLWYYGFGPGAFEVKGANDLVARANSHYRKADAIITDITVRGFQWKQGELKTSEQVEKLTAELEEEEKKVETSKGELDQSNRYLKQAQQLRLPSWYNDYLDLLLRRNEALSNGLDVAQGSFRDVSRLMDLFPDLSQAIAKLSQLPAKMDEVNKAVSAGDAQTARARIQEADSLLSEVSALLISVNVELQSKDVDALLQLISGAKGILVMTRQMVDASERGDVSRVDELKKRIDTAIIDLKKNADKIGAVGDFEDWFARRLDFYLENIMREFNEAIDFDVRARALYEKNT